MSKSNKFQEVVAAIISIQDHDYPCDCSQCQIDSKTIQDNPIESQAAAKLLAKTQSK